MPYTTLISTETLNQHLGHDDWAIIDCRFSLADTELGRQNYRQAHIPGAQYAHLDEDLSGPIVPGQTSRHPLPTIETFAKTLSGWGIDAEVQVVVYDDLGGAIAGRLWWMLQWLGHESVAVLDGGWKAWQAENRPVESQVTSAATREFKPQPRPELVVTAAEVMALRTDPAHRLLDSRSADRYRGENETIDPVAGHIPGARSAPFAQNLDETGHFLPAEALRRRFEDILGVMPAENAIFYCGSGVTAAHNVLALAHAGLGNARLYAGSWSEWITDPTRPVEAG